MLFRPQEMLRHNVACRPAVHFIRQNRSIVSVLSSCCGTRSAKSLWLCKHFYEQKLKENNASFLKLFLGRKLRRDRPDIFRKAHFSSRDSPMHAGIKQHRTHPLPAELSKRYVLTICSSVYWNLSDKHHP